MFEGEFLLLHSSTLTIVPSFFRLADKGHVVVGAELSSLAIEDFFKENNVEYTSSPVAGLKDTDLYTVGIS